MEALGSLLREHFNIMWTCLSVFASNLTSSLNVHQDYMLDCCFSWFVFFLSRLFALRASNRCVEKKRGGSVCVHQGCNGMSFSSRLSPSENEIIYSPSGLRWLFMIFIVCFMLWLTRPQAVSVRSHSKSFLLPLVWGWRLRFVAVIFFWDASSDARNDCRYVRYLSRKPPLGVPAAKYDGCQSGFKVPVTTIAFR